MKFQVLKSNFHFKLLLDADFVGVSFTPTGQINRFKRV